jgi:hypothetical protein
VLASESVIDRTAAPQRAGTERHAERLAIEYPPSRTVHLAHLGRG